MKLTWVVLLGLCGLVACSALPNLDKVAQSENVILVHGLGRNANAMWVLANRLEAQGYRVCPVDYATFDVSVSDMFASTTRSFDDCLAQGENHFVGHSLGGIMIRQYLAEQAASRFSGSVVLGKVVLFGTPNHGSEVADHFRGSWLMEWAGEAAQVLTTGQGTLGETIAPSSVQMDVPIGVIAGTQSSAMTHSLFSGPNDGLVSVESTQLANMADFITLDVSHSAMRYDSEVAYQILHYLQTGHFDHDSIDE